MADKILALSKEPVSSANIVRLVREDSKTYTIQFVVERYSGGIDLSTLTWSVNLKTSNNSKYYYPVSVVSSDEEKIYIDWNVKGAATNTVGKTFYTVEGKTSASDPPVWRSSLQVIEVSEGIGAGAVFEPEDVSAVEELVNEVREIVDGGVRFDTAQSLSDAEKTRALNNIGALNEDTLNSFTTALTAEYTNTLFYNTSAANKWALVFGLPAGYTSLLYKPYFCTTGSSGTEVTEGTFTLTHATVDAQNNITALDTGVAYKIGDTIALYGIRSNDIWFVSDATYSGSGTVQLSYSNAAHTTFTGAALATASSIAVGQQISPVANVTASGEFTLIARYALPHSILFGKKISVIGDSITAVTDKASAPWPALIQTWTGAAVQNLGINGTGFVRKNPYINRISQIDSDADIIGVACSFNDLVSSSGLPLGTATDTGTNTVGGYIHDFFDALTTAKPTTPLICYSEGPWGYRRPGNEDNGGTSVYRSGDYIALVKEVCALYGVPFYDGLYWGCELKPWITANQTLYYTDPLGEKDDVHPNNLGHKIIARYLYPRFAENIVGDGLTC